MVQADSDRLGCVCTVCGYRCRDCLGTDTVVTRENLRSLAFDPRFSPEALAANFADPGEETWEPRETNEDMAEEIRRKWRDL